MTALLIVLATLVVLLVLLDVIAFFVGRNDGAKCLDAYLDERKQRDVLLEINRILVEKEVSIYDLYDSNNADEYNELLAYGKTPEEVEFFKLDEHEFYFLKTYLLHQDVGKEPETVEETEEITMEKHWFYKYRDYMLGHKKGEIYNELFSDTHLLGCPCDIEITYNNSSDMFIDTFSFTKYYEGLGYKQFFIDFAYTLSTLPSVSYYDIANSHIQSHNKNIKIDKSNIDADIDYTELTHNIVLLEDSDFGKWHLTKRTYPKSIFEKITKGEEKIIIDWNNLE